MRKKYQAVITRDYYVVNASGKTHHFIKGDTLTIPELNRIRNKFALESKDYIIEEVK